MTSDGSFPDEHPFPPTGVASVAGDAHRRLMNRDGSFNTVRAGSPLDSVSYLSLFTMTWARFFSLIAILHLVSNLLFGMAYFVCGPSALSTNGPIAHVNHLWTCFFFSIQTLSTIGYGGLVPISLAANLLVAIESIYGLLTYALITGLFFARVSRTRARIRFSKTAVIAPEGDERYFQLRLTNRSRSEILDVSARVIYSRIEEEGAESVQRFTPLELQRTSVAFLPLAWSLRHRIDKSSPLFGEDTTSFDGKHVEILVLVTGLDESSGQTVTSRTSYVAAEIMVDRQHSDIYRRDDAGNILGIELDRFDSVT
jgi:inward rectifier potassium channel